MPPLQVCDVGRTPSYPRSGSRRAPPGRSADPRRCRRGKCSRLRSPPPRDPPARRRPGDRHLGGAGLVDPRERPVGVMGITVASLAGSAPTLGGVAPESSSIGRKGRRAATAAGWSPRRRRRWRHDRSRRCPPTGLGWVTELNRPRRRGRAPSPIRSDRVSDAGARRRRRRTRMSTALHRLEAWPSAR